MLGPLVGSGHVRVGVLASGGGSILEAILADGIPVEVVLVDRPCAATDVAARFGVEAVEVVRSSFGAGFDRVAYTEQVVDALTSRGIDLVVMAGFGTILEKPMQDAYGGRVLNSHPALLPSFPGWHAVADALAHGVKVTGTTIHVAGLEVDTGPILAQEAVEVRPDDTVESLHERIKVVERRLYPDTIRQILERGSVLP
jgi:phosphoribosylglycinamide formyltransferase 1